MILVDTSIWVTHFRTSLPALEVLIDQQEILCHSLVIGELALGHLQPREETLGELTALPRAIEAGTKEVLPLIASERLFGTGVGLIDVHLLAAARLSDALLWTTDKRLLAAAFRLSLNFSPDE